MLAQQNFSYQEWLKVREQIHLLLTAIWRFEIICISGYAVFFGWFLSKYTPTDTNPEKLYLLCASTFFSLLVFSRLKVEYGILMVLAEYSKELEDYLYDPLKKKPEGWERYLEKNKPDDFGYFNIFLRYRSTGLGFIFLIAINSFALFYFNNFNLLDVRDGSFCEGSTLGICKRYF